jgi:hypothetical protein
MKHLWCWRCQKTVAMLEAEEWARMMPVLADFSAQISAHYAERAASMEEASAHGNPQPALKLYFDMTGCNETNIACLWHHRVELYGEPCENCHKPLRTPGAHFCAECWAAVTIKPKTIRPSRMPSINNGIAFRN